MTIWICRWRMNTSVTSQYQPRLSSITKIFSRQISQSDCSIQIKLNYINMKYRFFYWTKDKYPYSRHYWKLILCFILFMSLSCFCWSLYCLLVFNLQLLNFPFWYIFKLFLSQNLDQIMSFDLWLSIRKLGPNCYTETK